MKKIIDYVISSWFDTVYGDIDPKLMNGQTNVTQSILVAKYPLYSYTSYIRLIVAKITSARLQDYKGIT